MPHILELEEDFEDFDEIEREDLFSSEDSSIQADKPVGIWISYIKNRMKLYNTNYNVVIVGEPGSGKSWSALRLAQAVNPQFKNNPLIVFSVYDYVKAIKNDIIPKGGVIVFDEVGVAVNKRMWHNAINHVMNVTFQTVRSRNFTTVFTTPFSDFVDKDTRKLFHAILKAQNGFYKDTRHFTIYKYVYNEFYDKYIRKKITFSVDGQQLTLSKVIFKKPSSKLIRQYEEMKAKFQKELYDSVFEKLREIVEEKDKGKVDNMVKSVMEVVMNNFDDYLVEKRGIMWVNVNKISSKLGVSKKVAGAVADLIEKQNAIGKYAGEI